MAVKVVSYSKGKVIDQGQIDFKKAAELKDDVVWVNVTNPSRPEIDALGVAYGFHPLALDDCLHTVQRPKVEEYEGYMFLVVKIMCCDPSIKSIQLSMFLSGNYLVTVSKEEVPVIKELMARIISGGHKAESEKSDYLLYMILDRTVDDYFTVLDRIEEDIEIVEKEVVGKPKNSTVQKIFKIKKDLLYFRKPVWPTREVMHNLQSRQIEYISPALTPYYRDVYDHMIQIIDLVDTYRDLISSALDVYMSSVSNSLNEVIKVLTVLATIFLLPTLISGIYGMNYKLFPSNDWQYGFYFALLLMVLSTIIPLVYFKRKGWI